MRDPEVHVVYILCHVALFLSEVLGVVAVDQLLIERLETFCFGGSDAFVAPEEAFLIELYHGCLCREIWGNCELTFAQKVTIMMQFDDDDLQQLIVEEDVRFKQNVI